MSRARRAVLVSHFHWDREWHRTFEAYRARLVDAIDCVLDLVAVDPGYRFLLDGQAIVLEDYLAVRPGRRAELERGLRTGRLAAGPWYVQPDSLLPSGEAHVRNLLLGRRVAGALGPVSRVGYVPDSFGHPAQLPQLFRGFGIDSVVYWRGNGDELDDVGTWYAWEAPDGSRVSALCLRDGYFSAACLPADVETAANGLAALAHRHADEPEPVLLMNGFDHMPPDAHVGAVVEALAARDDLHVARGLLEDVLAARPSPTRTFRGELTGARLANLLSGVWSSRMDVKLRNRACETLLTAWAEPWAALGRALGLPDERPALEQAWRTLVRNQAHDSLCGCSLDAVMAAVVARFEAADGLARETVGRVLERLAGRDADRQTPPGVAQEIVVFNPSPHARTDVVRVPLDPYPAMRLPLGVPEFPALAPTTGDAPGFAIDGRPVRVVPAGDPSRVRWLPGATPLDVELVVADVPAFGCRRLRLEPAAPSPDRIDDGREIASDAVRVRVADDGTLAVRLGGRDLPGLFALEDAGDRGDTYDFDPLADEPGAALASVAWTRHRHASGLEALVVRRRLRVPRALADDREGRSVETVEIEVTIEVRVAPGVPRLDATITIDNTARDHRLRVLFPSGGAVGSFRAATTFDTVVRSTAPSDDTRWVHPAPRTFVHQGWIEANGLAVVAPGLPEAEVTPEGTIALTLVRATGWLARYDLRSRPIPAGPPMPLEGAQCVGRLVARVALLAGGDERALRDAEVGLAGVIGGPAPLARADVPLLAVEPRTVLVTAVKPADERPGIVVRLSNPTDATVHAVVRAGLPISGAETVRLDETTLEGLTIDRGTMQLALPPHALRSLRIW
jgi:mannosylglycerate hydrolase